MSCSFFCFHLLYNSFLLILVIIGFIFFVSWLGSWFINLLIVFNSGFIFFVNCSGSLCQWGGAEESRWCHKVQGLPCQVRSKCQRSTDSEQTLFSICLELCPLYASVLLLFLAFYIAWMLMHFAKKKCFKCYGVTGINLCWISSNRSHDGLFPR